MDRQKNDRLIDELISAGRITVDTIAGKVFSTSPGSRGKPLGSKTRKGYLRTQIFHGGRPVDMMIHRIVWIAENGVPLIPDLDVDHLNRDKTDNRIRNLQLVPIGENLKRAHRAGVYRKVSA